MTTRRALLAGLGALALAAVLSGAYWLGAFREAMRQARRRLATRCSVLQSSVGPLEYAVAGDGPPLMMIHGNGGGFDQGLLFSDAIRRRGFRIVAPSRFGYPEGGHIWLGHDEDVADEIAGFVGTSPPGA